MNELRSLMNEWLVTLETRQDNWEGVIASEQQIARDFLINGQPDTMSFLDWLDGRGVNISITTNRNLCSDLREVWALVSERPGISLRDIGTALGFSSSKAKTLVDELTESGSLIREPGKIGTLRATVPLITMRRK